MNRRKFLTALGAGAMAMAAPSALLGALKASRTGWYPVSDYYVLFVHPYTERDIRALMTDEYGVCQGARLITSGPASVGTFRVGDDDIDPLEIRAAVERLKRNHCFSS